MSPDTQFSNQAFEYGYTDINCWLCLIPVEVVDDHFSPVLVYTLPEAWSIENESLNKLSHC